MAEKPTGLHVVFFDKRRLDRKASDEAKSPIYHMVPYVRIKIPGDNKRVIEAPANERVYLNKDVFSNAMDDEWTRRSQAQGAGRMSYAEFFPQHWAVFEANRQEVYIEGTPVDQLYGLTDANRATLKGQNVLSIETLASLEGKRLSSLGMGAQRMKDLATEYLAKANGGSEAVEALQTENAEMQAQLRALSEQLAAMKEVQPAPKRTRRPATAEEA